MTGKLKLAFIIPTIGRYDKLNSLLDNIEHQTVIADLIIIVDTGDNYSEDKLGSYGYPIKYVHTGSNSLTEGRNTGIKNVPLDFDLIGFLDDDVILYKDTTEIMINFWRNAADDIGGAAFNIITNGRSRKLWALKRLFFMGDRIPGNVLRSGYQTAVENIVNDVYAKWLPGGATVWRKEIFSMFKFDENLKGHAHIEDMDFSYRVGRKYKLLVLAKAQLVHNPHPISGSKENINFGISEIVNRFYFINKNREFSRIMFYWASLGKLFENIVFGIFTFNPNYLKRALGNILGMQTVTFNKRQDIL